MPLSKSLGLDGIYPALLSKFWHIVRYDVGKAVLSVLHAGHMLHKVNFIHIVMIPKINEPKSMSDCRPISLGNVMSRLISKVIANRLKHILPNVIFDAQSAFVPDCLITDKIL